MILTKIYFPQKKSLQRTLPPLANGEISPYSKAQAFLVNDMLEFQMHTLEERSFCSSPLLKLKKEGIMYYCVPSVPSVFQVCT